MDHRSLLHKLFPTARRLLLERSLEKLPLSDCSRILVAGAGDDPYRKLFRNAELYVASDIMSFAHQTTVLADVQMLPFKNNVFDCILATEVLEHLDKPQYFVDEAYRVLEEDGRLIVTVPFMFHTHADPSDYWRPTRHGLKLLFEKFEYLSIVDQGGRLAVISDLITTSLKHIKVSVLLRIFNHFLVLFYSHKQLSIERTSAPTGFMVIAEKRNKSAQTK